jgi:hypothetical protein
MFPIIPANSAAVSGNKEGIFGFGQVSGNQSMTNLVSDAGVISSDVTGVGIERYGLTACEYGEDTGLFFGGYTGLAPFPYYVSTTNLISSSGTVASDTTSVASGKGEQPGGARYGGDKGIIGFGYAYTPGGGGVSWTNLVTNAGVIGSDVTGVGYARYGIGACEYGDEKAIFGYGNTEQGAPYVSPCAITNLVSTSGVVATDQVATTGTIRYGLVACSYGGDKGIFGCGYDGTTRYGLTNLVSNTGVVATDTAAVGAARDKGAATQYGGNKGIIGFGHDGSTYLASTNLVSNSGVVASDTAGVVGATARGALAACSLN